MLKVGCAKINYFVFTIAMQFIVIHLSIKDCMIPKFMEIYSITVHTTSTKTILCPRSFPHGTHFLDMQHTV